MKYKNYIFTYLLFGKKEIKEFIKKSCKKFQYELYIVYRSTKNNIVKFIYGIANSKAVITDSYHGTLFSIIFNKPFVSLINKEFDIERFN